MCLDPFVASNVECKTCTGTGRMRIKIDPQLDHRRDRPANRAEVLIECRQCHGTGYYSQGMFKPKQDVRPVLEPHRTLCACG